jgi:hypothetical protein
MEHRLDEKKNLISQFCMEDTPPPTVGSSCLMGGTLIAFFRRKMFVSGIFFCTRTA